MPETKQEREAATALNPGSDYNKAKKAKAKKAEKPKK